MRRYTYLHTQFIWTDNRFVSATANDVRC